MNREHKQVGTGTRRPRHQLRHLNRKATDTGLLADAIAKRLMNTPNSGNNRRRGQRVNRNSASPTDVLNMIKMASTHCVLSRTARNGRHSESSFVRIKQGTVNNLQLATATHIRQHDDWAILSILQRSIVRHEKLTWLGVGGPEGAKRSKVT